MITKILPIEKLKQLFTEILLNNTDKVTKIAPGSVLNGTAYGIAKLAQKTLKDIAVIEANIFPDTATGQYLDNIAEMRGIAPRLGESKSSGYVRVFATPGTQYLAGYHKFFSDSGITFEVTESYTVSDVGYGYVKVKSEQVGSNTNIPPLAITNVSPIPVGHEYAINEYQMQGGRDTESDEVFRQRIKRSLNILSKNTLEYLTQLFLKYNSDILRVFNYGFTDTGKIRLAIVTTSGRQLSQTELQELLDATQEYLSITESLQYGTSNQSLELVNVEWEYIDISFRVDIDANYDVYSVLKEIQVNINQELDWRTWDSLKKVEWDNLLTAVKRTKGVKYVPDNHFYPRTDIFISKYKLPRVRGFEMLNLQGDLILANNNIKPVYYPAETDFEFIATVLKDI